MTGIYCGVIGAVMGASLTGVGWLVKRTLQRHSEEEALRRDRMRIENAERFIEAHSKATEAGINLAFPLERLTQVLHGAAEEDEDSLSEDERAEALMTYALTLLSAHLQHCFRMERIAGIHEDCVPDLEDSRTDFLMAYGEVGDALKLSDEPSLPRLIEAYRAYVENPTELQMASLEKAFQAPQEKPTIGAPNVPHDGPGGVGPSCRRSPCDPETSRN